MNTINLTTTHGVLTIDAFSIEVLTDSVGAYGDTNTLITTKSGQTFNVKEKSEDISKLVEEKISTYRSPYESLLALLTESLKPPKTEVELLSLTSVSNTNPYANKRPETLLISPNSIESLTKTHYGHTIVATHSGCQYEVTESADSILAASGKIKIIEVVDELDG